MAAEELPGFVDNLRSFYEEEYSGVYYRKLSPSDDLESKSKKAFDDFLKSHQNTYPRERTKYFAEWEKVYSSTGPFNTEDDITSLLNQLKNPTNFQAALQMEQLLVNRDDATEAEAAFKSAFASQDNKMVEQYYLGDDDIIHGVMVSAMRKDNTAVFLVLLMD